VEKVMLTEYVGILWRYSGDSLYSALERAGALSSEGGGLSPSSSANALYRKVFQSAVDALVASGDHYLSLFGIEPYKYDDFSSLEKIARALSATRNERRKCDAFMDSIMALYNAESMDEGIGIGLGGLTLKIDYALSHMPNHDILARKVFQNNNYEDILDSVYESFSKAAKLYAIMRFVTNYIYIYIKIHMPYIMYIY
jgi:hypothetical protein